MTYAAMTAIELDAGHRVPLHESKCKNPHGHRYRIEAVVLSEDLFEETSQQGMVLDFGLVKRLLTEKVHDVLDHGFIIFRNDRELIQAMWGRDWNIILFPYVPTAENIARWVYEQLAPYVRQMSNEDHKVWLDGVVVHETPNNKAIYRPSDPDPVSDEELMALINDGVLQGDVVSSWRKLEG